MSDSQRTRTTTAVLAVAILLVAAIPLAAILVSDSVTASDSEYYTVVYHPYISKTADADGKTVSITYYSTDTTDSSNTVVSSYTASQATGSVNSTYNDTGAEPSDLSVKYAGHVISTEYNPQFWSGTIKGTDSDGNAITSNSNWYAINTYAAGSTLVFTGWKYEWESDNSTHYPGDVITDPTSAKNTGDKCIHIYATWGYLKNYDEDFVADIEGWSGGNVYTNIVKLKTTFSYSGKAVDMPLTIRGDGTTSAVLSSDSGKMVLTNDAIIDNLTLLTASDGGGENHGDGDWGLMANGHTLVIGTGVGIDSSASSNSSAAQVFGGSYEDVSSSTNVIIHSGIYYNVIAGGNSSKVAGDTKLVMRGGTVLDTIIGASTKNYSSNNHGEVTGSTYIYLLGDVRLVGDYYEEHALDNSYTGENGGKIQLTESTILTGGSNSGTVKGNTNVHITGNATAWDVQGGGRRGDSQIGTYDSSGTTITEGTGTANLTVSGNAVIKHALCGSITDGLNGYSGNSGAKQCVKNVNITVKGNASVASVFGAGYDTYYEAKYSSMYNGGKISIDIEGGTVGYVYGGGYRGAIGYSSEMGTGVGTSSPLESITINITGGKVLYDVFGGGRGGLDKTCHDTSGGDSWADSDWDATGRSHVNVETISITVGSKAEIYGNVYGGGESTPIITSYDGISSVYNGTLRSNGNTSVASTYCNSLTINVEGTVNGSVYGAGKGVNTEDIGATDVNGKSGRHSSAYIFALKSNSTGYEIARIPWIGNGTPASTDMTTTSGTYDKFAYVKADKVSISVTGTVGDGTENAGVYTDGVYGGGQMGQLGDKDNCAEITVTIGNDTSKGTVNGNVFGAGEGTSNEKGHGAVYASSVTLNVNNSEVTGNIYGGGEMGRLGNYNADSSEGTVETVLVDKVSIDVSSSTVGGSVFGAGKGNSSTTGFGAVHTSAVSVSVSNSTVAGNIYGGGEIGRLGDSEKPLDSVTVTVSKSTVTNIFGAGEGNEKALGYGAVYAKSVTVNAKEDSTVTGNIYGGGNMGRLGDKSNCAVVSVSVSSSDVNGSVFGAGKGNTTIGYGAVYASSVTVSIGESSNITGNVYGGGEMGRLGNYNTDPTAGDVETIIVNSVSVNVSSSTVGGSVFGAGKGNSSTTGFGAVHTSAVSVDVVNSAVTKSVYGGGEMGRLGDAESLATVSVTVSSGSVIAGSVYGAGEGNSAKIGYGAVYAGSVTVIIKDTGTTVKNNVYGGGNMGRLGNETSGTSSELVDTVAVNITNANVDGTVYGAGRGEVVRTTVDGKTLTSDGEETTNEVGNYGTVHASNIVININSATVGSVFGGGEKGILGCSDHTASIAITVKSTTVNGAVCGAGKGTSYDIGSKTGAAAAYTSKITIDISGTSDRKTSVTYADKYSVFGGSKFAYTSASDMIYITLGENALLNGDVHAGGFGGDAESTSAQTADTNILDASRTVVLNGAEVRGTIYGGSRLGNDGSDTADTREFKIYLLAGTVKKDVYGGGLQGKSYYNAEIYFGTPAAEASGIVPYTGSAQYPTLKVNSIYGGGQMSSGNQAYTSALLFGNVSIKIGSSSSTSLKFGGYGSGTSGNILITGDVYGDGNYSLISGTSNVRFENYQQTGSTPMLSLQRIDTLYMKSTDITLNGSGDGGTTELSHLLSMSRIDLLTMDGSVTLNLNCESYLLKKMISSINGTNCEPSVCAQADVRNTIVLNSGSILRVGQVTDTSGKVDYPVDGAENPITGYTYLKVPDGETYWGAFVIGPEKTYTFAGFMTGDDGNVPVGDIVISGTTTTGGQRIWYISGHSSISRTVMLEYGKSWTASDIDLAIPMISSSGTTKMVFSMPYVDSKFQGGLYAVTDSDYNAYTGDIGTATYVSIKYTDGSKTGDMATHKLVDGSWQPVTSGDYQPFSGNVTVKLASSAEYIAGKGSTGIIGNIVVSVTEAMSFSINGKDQYIPINSIDYLLEIYVGPRTDGDTVDMTFNMMVDNADSVSGLTYIDLPITTATSGDQTTSGIITTYAIGGITFNWESGKTGTGSLTMSEDKEHLGYNPWISVELTGTATIKSTDIVAYPVNMGEAGLKIAAVKTEYSGSYLPSITVVITGTYINPYATSEADKNKTITYNCTINLVKEQTSKLYAAYDSIDTTSERYWLTVTGTGVNSNPWSFAWTKQTTKGIQGVFTDGNRTDGITLDYGTVIDRMKFWVKSADGSVSEKTVIDALKETIVRIPDSTEGSNKFVYSENFYGWYIDEDTITQFDTSSEIRNNTTIFGGFGISVTFSGVTPTPIIIRIAPNTSLSASGIENITKDSTTGAYRWVYNTKGDCYDIAAKRGYNLIEVNGNPSWVIAGTDTAMKFDEALIASYSLELLWEPKKYSAEITVVSSQEADDDMSRLQFYEEDISTGEKTEVNAGNYEKTTADSKYEYKWTMQLTYTRAFSVNFGGYCVIKHNTNVYYQDGVTDPLTLTVRGLNTSALGFDVPLADGSNTGTENIVVKATINKAVSIPISLAGDTDYSQKLIDGQAVEVNASTKDDNNVTLETTIRFTGSSDATKYVAVNGTGTLEFTVGGKESNYTGTLQDIATGYYTDKTVTAKTVGSYSDTVSIAVNSTSTVGLERGIEIYLCQPYTMKYGTDSTTETVDDWSDIHGTVTYTPCDPLGKAGDTVTLSGTTTVTVYKGYTITITPVDDTSGTATVKYTFPDGYTVSGTDTVAVGSYTVNSSADVIVKPMTPANAKLELSITVMKADGTTEATDENYTKLIKNGWKFTFTVNSNEWSKDLVEKGTPYTVDIVSAYTYSVSVSMTGFESVGDVSITQTAENGTTVIKASAVLKAKTYNVNYYGYNKSDATYTDSAEYSIRATFDSSVNQYVSDYAIHDETVVRYIGVTPDEGYSVTPVEKPSNESYIAVYDAIKKKYIAENEDNGYVYIEDEHGKYIKVGAVSLNGIGGYVADVTIPDGTPTTGRAMYDETSGIYTATATGTDRRIYIHESTVDNYLIAIYDAVTGEDILVSATYDEAIGKYIATVNTYEYNGDNTAKPTVTFVATYDSASGKYIAEDGEDLKDGTHAVYLYDTVNRQYIVVSAVKDSNGKYIADIAYNGTPDASYIAAYNSASGKYIADAAAVDGNVYIKIGDRYVIVPAESYADKYAVTAYGSFPSLAEYDEAVGRYHADRYAMYNSTTGKYTVFIYNEYFKKYTIADNATYSEAAGYAAPGTVVNINNGKYCITTWNVFSDTNVPYLLDAEDYVHVDENGNQTWVKNLRDSPELVSELNISVFGNSDTLFLYPVPDPHSMDIDKTVEVANAVVEQWSTDTYRILDNLFTQDVTFTVKADDTEYTVKYVVKTQRLEVPAVLGGSGYLTLITSDGLFRLNLTVVPSLTGAIV